MRAELLHVFSARFNPIRWETPQKLFEQWTSHMLDSGVKLTIIEVQYGERPFCCDISPHINHIGLRADSWAWTKENLINIGIARVPEAKYICWHDSDVWHRRPSWAVETVHALQHYRFIQPWSDAYDLGPHDEHLAHFKSFCWAVAHGKTLVPDRHGWKHCYDPYPHPGYVWASTRRVLEYPGGLFELGGMGASDHAMALALVGKAVASAPKNSNPAYIEALKTWQDRLLPAVNGRIGYVHGTIEHHFHGAKKSRGYLSRWSMFLRHGFDPISDLKRNTFGVLEFAGNKPELEREWDLYLRSRNEDSNYAGD